MRAAYRIEEVTARRRHRGRSASTLRDARVRERFGMTVLAVRDSDNTSWTYNPDASEKIGPGMTLVVLGSPEQVSALRAASA